MKFEITEKPSEIEIVRHGEVVGTIKFNAFDVTKRQEFYALYSKLSSQNDKIFSNLTDNLGVPVALEQATKEAAKLYDELSASMDIIFGADSMALLTDDNKDPALLMQFLTFAAKEFKNATGLKIDKYTKPIDSDVML